MKSGETLNLVLNDQPTVAVVRTEWFHSEDPPPRDRQPGTPWCDLAIVETEKGAFLARARERVKDSSGNGGVQRVRTVDCAWHRFDTREQAIDWLAERSRDGYALAGKALARLRAEEV